MTIAGELERVLAGNPLRSSGGRNAHGEWDWLDHVDRRTMRRLTGAGYFARAGLSIDEAADMICARVGGVDTLDDAIEWYVRTALAELDERQLERAGGVAWEDQERPDDAWAGVDFGDELDDSAPDDTLPVQFEAAECPSTDDGLERVVFPEGERTFYGSRRPVRVWSSWDSAPDDTLPRRRARRGSWWWRLRGWWSR